MNKDIEERIKKITKNENKNIYPNIPKNMLIECSNACNLSCIFCANRKMTRPKGKISSKFLNRILNEAFELGVREVGFYTTGEPLMNLELEKYINIAKKVGYEYIYITTNGILANINRIKELVKQGLDSIKFSINAINEKDYMLIHGKNMYNVAMNNLKEVWQWKIQNNINLKVYVSYISTKYTEYDIKLIENNFKDYCDKVLVTNVRNQSGLVPEIIQNLKNKNESNKIQGKRDLPCFYPFNTICITLEGYITACCTDFQNYLAYADLNKMTLKKAWYSKIITDLRQQHISGNLKNNLCNNCIFNTIKIPKPLNENLATEFDEKLLLNDQYMLMQLKKYSNIKIDKKIID